ncbi:MAG: ABC-type cobalamin/Fe3+-siderophores transport system ATPase subunit [Myxococcota bacterium]|jgi:ABC-type cobalamin/Fe3+-siderophores transport system ATPase subunit
MAQLDPSTQTVALKVVYCGPDGAGKSTNLAQVYRRYPKSRRGRLVTLDTDIEQGHFFEYFPVFLGRIDDFNVRADFLSTPSKVLVTSTRRALLESADGLVFVADSSIDAAQANVDALAELQTMVEPGSKPIVFQWNKRDHASAVSATLLESQLNQERAPSTEAIADLAEGVWETQRVLLNMLLAQLRAYLPTAPREGGKMVIALASARASQGPLDPRTQHPRTGRSGRVHATNQGLGAIQTTEGEELDDPFAVLDEVPDVDPGLPDALVQTLLEHPAVEGATFGVRSGVALASAGDVDGDIGCAMLSMSADRLAEGLALMGLGDVSTWCFGTSDQTWYVAQKGTQILGAVGAGTHAPESGLRAVFEGVDLP